VSVALKEVALEAVPVVRLRDAAGSNAWERLTEAQARAGELLAGRAVWSINSTATGGGVAEILRTILPYARAAGRDARWLIVRGSADFFRVTKRIHNFLHEHPGDGGELGGAERSAYERVIEDAGWGLRDVIGAGDIVVLHDPQTLGLAFGLKRLGATVIWRCHIGTEEPRELSHAAWDFLWPYVREPDVTVFSRHASVPPRLEAESVRIIVPSIDPCSVKNGEMQAELAAGILEHVGLVDRHGELSKAPAFSRGDGTQQPLHRQCDVLRSGPAPRLGCDQLVVHVCRWDRLKDPVGSMLGFAEHTLPRVQAHLILAGPSVHAVSDDPEAPEVLDEVQAAWRALPHEVRRRVTVACLPMHDIEENAAIVNALQRHADVIVKKSLEEGFGLGVTEALWKRRAVVASDVGGHRDQIQHQCSGLLVDPTDLRSFGNAIAELLADRSRAGAFGEAGHDVVKHRFLHSRQLAEWDELLATVAETKISRSATQSKVPTRRHSLHRGTPDASPRHDEARTSPSGGMRESELEERAFDPADRDPLTGLWNRRRFEDELDRRVARTRRRDAKRQALLAIDVDRYRDLIQRHGPAAAKELIRSVADVLAQRLRPNETLARVGGDEFAAILPGTTPRLVQGLADDLCTAVREQSHTVGSSRVHATISIGCIFFDAGAYTRQEALAAADSALYEAKTGGSDRAVVHESSPTSSDKGTRRAPSSGGRDDEDRVVEPGDQLGE
jgi:trehalose synthase